MADFRSDGKTPVARDVFTISVMTGASTGRTSRRREVGIGSRTQEALEAFLMMEIISVNVAVRKECNFEVDETRREFNDGQCKLSIEDSIVASTDRIFEIF